MKIVLDYRYRNINSALRVFLLQRVLEIRITFKKTKNKVIFMQVYKGPSNIQTIEIVYTPHDVTP